MTDIPGVEHHYAYINDIRMHYVRAGKGEKLLVLLHGFPQFWYMWRHHLGPLSEHFTVVAPDMRGYNLTDKPRWGYGIDVLVQDVVSLIQELGFETAIIAGHDWGGVVAWATAIAFPHRVERLVALNAPHPGLFREHLRTSAEQRRRSWYMAFFQLPWLPEAAIRANDYAILERMFRDSPAGQRAFSDTDISRYKTALAQPGALTAALNYYRALARGDSGMFSGTGLKVGMPTLLIWGENDIALGTELTQGNERFVTDLRVERLPGCSHWVAEECPDEVRRLMLEFLRT